MITIRRLLIAALFTLLVLPATADVNDEIGALAKERYQLTRQIINLFREKKLSNSPEYLAAKETAFAASSTHIKAQKSHPALTELYKKSDVAQKKWIDARIAKDKEAEKIARAEFTKTRMEISQAAQKIPELVEIQEKAIIANKAVQDKEKELLATTPEGEELVGKINALEAQMTELRKKIEAK